MYQDKPPIDELLHYGTKRHSGRYPWGSGENPYQHSGAFYSRVNELRKENFTYTDENGKTWTGDTAIAKSMGLTTTQFRTQYRLAKDEVRKEKVATAEKLREKGYSLNAIAEKMGYDNDSSVRALLNEGAKTRMNKAQSTADFLKEQVKEKKMIDVGAQTEFSLNASKEKMKEALYILELEGYHVYKCNVPQATNPGKFTVTKVLCPPGTEYKEIYNFEDIKTIDDYITRDGGETYEKKFHYPESMDSSRLQIRYAEDGGLQKDGVIELRRGVEDLSLGESRYSQVRILVDGTHYLKGMAVYSDDMPDGVDVIFNTNKTKDVAKMDVLKKIKSDPDNPFGSSIKDSEQGGQYWYEDSKTGEKKLGLINKRADEGDWNQWKDKLPAQFLSKQTLSLAKKQLNMSIEDKQREYDDICALDNPTVKKRMLNSFADDCDSAAVHLYAAALPRQKYHVILPLTSLSENEVYAPQYNDGEKVALVRFPHAGTFEIPIVTVNNKNPEGKNIISNTSSDAIGINSKVAERLSGADFDGDTVMVIPTNDKVKIKSRHQLKDLEGFDPKTEYKGYEGMKVMKNTQTEMGKISNLITDMTLRGASDEEMARAVKHSMVVIDAKKHELDYKRSYIENDIESLKAKYQGRIDEDGKYRQGASTLISRAKGEVTVDKRQGNPRVNLKGTKDYDPSRPEGALIYKTADDLEYQVTKTNKKGETTYVTKKKTQPSTQMAETDDAFTLVSDANTDMERAYATYANKMKALANQARKEVSITGNIKYDKEAAKTYAKEVASLNSKLNECLKNKPKERYAHRLAASVVNAKKQDNPDMSNEEIKKLNNQELKKARDLTGASRQTIEVTDNEWKAIQAGAISETKLAKILENTDIDDIRQKATPRTSTELSTAKKNSIRAMANRGYTIAEIAKRFGISTSTVNNCLNS